MRWDNSRSSLVALAILLGIVILPVALSGMGKLIYQPDLLSGLFSINGIFTIFIAFFALLGIRLAFTRKAEHVKAYIPSVCAALGVFCTFLGIYVGLSEFNTKDISGSIPFLLEGIKTAFFTSLVGMFASLVVKFIYTVLEDRQKSTFDEIDIFKNMGSTCSSLCEKLDTIHTDSCDTMENINKMSRNYSEPPLGLARGPKKLPTGVIFRRNKLFDDDPRHTNECSLECMKSTYTLFSASADVRRDIEIVLCSFL